MSNLSRRGLAALTVVFAMAAVVATTSVPTHAQQKPVIKVSSLTLPVFNPLVWNIMKARGFDTKMASSLMPSPIPRFQPSMRLSPQARPTSSSAARQSSRNFIRKASVPVRIIGTGFTLADLVIFTKNDKIKSLADLKGKQLAVDMGGSQFQVTKMYTAAKGLDLGRDIIVVNANFAVARAQLEADRVDAGSR